VEVCLNVQVAEPVVTQLVTHQPGPQIPKTLRSIVLGRRRSVEPIWRRGHAATSGQSHSQLDLSFVPGHRRRVVADGDSSNCLNLFHAMVAWGCKGHAASVDAVPIPALAATFIRVGSLSLPLAPSNGDRGDPEPPCSAWEAGETASQVVFQAQI